MSKKEDVPTRPKCRYFIFAPGDQRSNCLNLNKIVSKANFKNKCKIEKIKVFHPLF